MSYVEGYILPVKTAQMDDYKILATKIAALWIKLGALSVIEAKADHAPVGELTSFPRAVLLQADETVVISYVTYRDRAHRNAVITLATQDAEMLESLNFAGLDGKRMVWGGFEVIIAV